VVVNARDGVSDPAALRVRYRHGDGAWRDAGAVPARVRAADLASLEVEVRDEAGNLALAAGAELPEPASRPTLARVAAWAVTPARESGSR
jgi:hypothetical protein